MVPGETEQISRPMYDRADVDGWTAIYNYCCSHDLNLVLCKASQVKEVQLMLDTVKQLGIFFKYSPKRSRRLEAAVVEVNPEDPTRTVQLRSQEPVADRCNGSMFPLLPQGNISGGAYTSRFLTLISQLELRFGTLAKKAIHAMCLIPSALHTCNKEEVYGDDLPDARSLDQEMKIQCGQNRKPNRKPYQKH